MLVRRTFLGVLAAAALTAWLPAREPASGGREFFIKDGDRVVMMGDSITEQLLYSNYVETWTVSRFPAWQLTFRNVGIGGDTSGGGNSRFKRDVLAYNPTVLTVDFGMNDGGYQPFNPKRFDPYMKGLQGIADQAKAAGIRVAWITPQPIEHNPGDNKEAYNDTLEKFSAGVKEIAQKNGGLFVDQFHPYAAVVKKARDAGTKGRITAGDAVHPGPPGQAVMAVSILKGMHFPSLVSSVSLSVGAGDARGVNCKVTDVAAKDDAVRFKRLDNALPYFPEQARSILKWAPLLEEMNQYGLQVKGLKPGRYEVRLGGKKVAEHSAEDLAKGVNLAEGALKAGPVADQVKAVWEAVQQKNSYFKGQVFQGVVRADPKKSPAFKDVPPDQIATKKRELYEERMKRMPELDAAVRSALQMRPHEVEIVAAAGKE